VRECWIVDLRAERVELHRSPGRRRRRYRVVAVAPRRTCIVLVAFSGVSIAANDLLP
jgi:hypothetical protein